MYEIVTSIPGMEMQKVSGLSRAEVCKTINALIAIGNADGSLAKTSEHTIERIVFTIRDGKFQWVKPQAPTF